MSTSNVVCDVGAEAAAAPTPSASKPLVLRAVIGALALLGLSGIGAVSMLAGLDGAHASPPGTQHGSMASSSASTGPSPAAAPSPSTSATEPSTPVGSADPSAPACSPRMTCASPRSRPTMVASSSTSQSSRTCGKSQGSARSGPKPSSGCGQSSSASNAGAISCVCEGSGPSPWRVCNHTSLSIRQQGVRALPRAQWQSDEFAARLGTEPRSTITACLRGRCARCQPPLRQASTRCVRSRDPGGRRA